MDSEETNSNSQFFTIAEDDMIGEDSKEPTLSSSLVFEGTKYFFIAPILGEEADDFQ